MASQQDHKIDMAPDPDEDDLDDLDDVLDEFEAKPKLPAATKPSTSTRTQPTPLTSGPGRPAAIEDEEDLAAQLQTGMSNLMSELGDDPDMQKQFEAMMQELIAAGAASTDDQAAAHVQKAAEQMPRESGDKNSNNKGKGEDNFSSTIRKTMERMQQSGDAATAATSSGAGGARSEEDMLLEMMKSLQGASGGDGAAGGGEEDFNSMLMSMMTQLTNKDILYEPMKELDEKFPAWMAKSAGAAKKEDLLRYQEQERLVGEIVRRFERDGYNDENEDDREYIVERMQKMQAAGSPPPDLVGDMSAAQEALGDLDAGCPTQ